MLCTTRSGFPEIPAGLAPAAAALLLHVFPAVSPATANPAGQKVKLMLPSNVTIHLANHKTISGVRLAAVSPSQVTFEKGGRRSLPLADLARIAFQGEVTLKSKGGYVVRGDSFKGCGRPNDVILAAAALEIQPDGSVLALNPDRMPNTVVKDLRQTSLIKTLVVQALRFNPGGKVRVEYKACAPAA